MAGGRTIHVEGFSHQNPIPSASRVGGLVVSTIIGAVDPETKETPASLDEQCALVFANMQRILTSAGAKTGDIVKVVIYMEDPGRQDVVNAHWVKLFPNEDDRPVRHTHRETLAGTRLIAADFVAVVSD
jgi:enamine deaminase RidA (YjgF/YER057c/UK114 family)